MFKDCLIQRSKDYTFVNILNPRDHDYLVGRAFLGLWCGSRPWWGIIRERKALMRGLYPGIIRRCPFQPSPLMDSNVTNCRGVLSFNALMGDIWHFHILMGWETNYNSNHTNEPTLEDKCVLHDYLSCFSFTLTCKFHNGYKQITLSVQWQKSDKVGQGLPGHQVSSHPAP